MTLQFQELTPVLMRFHFRSVFVKSSTSGSYSYPEDALREMHQQGIDISRIIKVEWLKNGYWVSFPATEVSSLIVEIRQKNNPGSVTAEIGVLK